jgi:hypothetical protein
MKIKSFNEFLNESVDPCLIPWNEVGLTDNPSMEVADVVEETLLTKNLLVVEEECEIYHSLLQLKDTEKGEIILQVPSNEVTLFNIPFEFIKWDILGTDSKPINSWFIIKTEDLQKIKNK